MSENSISENNNNEQSLFPSFKKAFTHTFLMRGLNVIIGLLASIILARALGAEGRGKLALFIVTVQILLPVGTLVYGSNSILLGENNERKGKLILHTFLFVSFITFVIVLSILFLNSSTRAFFLGSEHLALVWLLFCLLWVNMIEVGLGELLLAKQDFFSINYTRISSSILYLLLLFVFLWVLDFGINTAITALICQQSLMVIIYLKKLSSEKNSHFSYSRFKIDYQLIKKSISINKRTFFAGIPNLLLLKVDILILGILTTNYAVGLYQITVTICMMVMILGEITNKIAKGKAVSEKGNQVIKSSLLASKFIFFIGILCYVFILLFGKDLLGIFYGEEFRQSYKSLEILFIATIFWGGTLPLVGFIVGRYKYPRAIVIGMNIAMILNIGLNLLLIPAFLEVGAAIASLIAYLFMALVFIREFKRRTNIYYKDFFRLSDREILLIKRYVRFPWK